MHNLPIVWADNGDTISQQYAGTGALKSDFTRTGKRTIFGLLQDGIKSAVRYYKTNFTDGYRQDAIDLTSGRYVVDPSLPSPFAADARSLLFRSPLHIMTGLALVTYLTGWVFGKTGLADWLPRPLPYLVSLIPGILFLSFALRNGAMFVRYPRLCPPPVNVYAASVSPNPYAKKVHII